MRQDRIIFLFTPLIILFVTLFAFSSLIFAPTTTATTFNTITVDSNADIIATDNRCTLREAIINANYDNQSGSVDCTPGSGADTILFDASLNNATITLINGQIIISDTLSIQGLGQDTFTIDGNYQDRIFRIIGTSTNTIDALLYNMRLINGSYTTNDSDDRGGAVYATYTNLTIRDVTFRNNHILSPSSGANGGALAMAISSGYLINVDFSNNTATGYLSIASGSGGAAHFLGSNINMNNVTFHDNQAYGAYSVANGGAFASQSTSVYINNSQFYNNSSSVEDGLAYGGAIADVYSSNIQIENSAIYSNVVTGAIPNNINYIVSNYGAGIGIQFGDLTITNTTVTSNTAATASYYSPSGGGIFIRDGNLHMNQTTLRHNSVLNPDDLTNSGGAGGGLYILRSNTYMTDTMIISNTAEFGGGAYLTINNDVLNPCATGGNIFRGAHVEDNYANQQGGGIYTINDGVYNCYHKIQESTISNNHANDDGGGIYAHNNGLWLFYSDVLSNSSHMGAGVYIGDSGIGNPIESYIDTTTISYNEGTHFGSGVYHDTDTTLAIRLTEISHNSTSWRGGGIAHFNGYLTILGTGIYNNEASFGGGIYFDGTSNGELAINHTSIAHNTSSSAGAAIYQWNGTNTQIANTTFSHNFASSSTPIYLRDGAATLTNVTIGNDTANNSAININPSLGAVMTMTNSIIDAGFTTACLNPINNLTGINIINDNSCSVPAIRADAQLSDLLVNDTTYFLLSRIPQTGSPALNAGDPVTCANAPISNRDQRNYSRTNDSQCDLGAIEKQTCNTPVTPNLNLFAQGDDAYLSWSTPTGYYVYEIYRSITDPYFTPTTPYAYGSTSYTDEGALNQYDTVYYTVLTRNECGQTSSVQSMKGSFNYSLTIGN
ncbi:MAG TPA: choice-of-anchor Q domain-containing protein [Anaerolineae bacterium]|nr:choice-of-anchor Q domain-containing protein [Anaerolineae bacterium]